MPVRPPAPLPKAAFKPGRGQRLLSLAEPLISSWLSLDLARFLWHNYGQNQPFHGMAETGDCHIKLAGRIERRHFQPARPPGGITLLDSRILRVFAQHLKRINDDDIQIDPNGIPLAWFSIGNFRTYRLFGVHGCQGP